MWRSSLRANPVAREGDRRMLDRFSSRTVDDDGSAAKKSDPSIGRRRVNGNQRCSLLGPEEASFNATSERQTSVGSVGPREPTVDGGSWSWSVGEGGSSFAHAVLPVSGAVRYDDRQRGCSRYQLRTGSCDNLAPGRSTCLFTPGCLRFDVVRNR